MSTLSVAQAPAGRHGVSWKKLLGSTAVYVAVIAVVLIMLAPIVWLGITSIRPPIEISSVRLNLIPRNPTLQNYFTVFERYDMAMYLRTTTLISLIVVATNLIVGVPAAYALARYNFFGDKVIFGGIIFFRMIPPIAAIVPLFMLFEQFRLLGT